MQPIDLSIEILEQSIADLSREIELSDQAILQLAFINNSRKARLTQIKDVLFSAMNIKPELPAIDAGKLKAAYEDIVRKEYAGMERVKQ